MAFCRCVTIEDLNKLVIHGKIRTLIRMEEADHEKQFCAIAGEICKKEAVAVLLSGPSSSGKTTSANRLAIQLLLHGKRPVLISLDDYYIDRDKIAPGPDGRLDLEHIDTIDTELFARNLQDILNGERTQIPSFNFMTGKREWKDRFLRLEKESVIVIEGIHGLNPLLLPKTVDPRKIYRVYVSPWLPVDYWLPEYDLRLLRRIVRDHKSRGTTVQKTVAMWDSVRQGEKRWIFPYRENADVMFNSAARYEPAVLKKHIMPLLTAVPQENEMYGCVRAVSRLLEGIWEADVDDEIPPTSLLREFIGGNTFYRQ